MSAGWMAEGIIDNDVLMALEADLRCVELQELKERMDSFSREWMAHGEDLYSKLKNVFFWEVNGIWQAIFLATIREYQKDPLIPSLIYRARKVTIEQAESLSDQDFWEPPARVVGFGRLNEPGQQYLYVSPSFIDTPLIEAGVCNGDLFLFICYEMTLPLSLTEIGFSPRNLDSLSEGARGKLMAITDFLRGLFSLKGSDVYRITSMIGSLCEFSEDGWCYPSYANKGGINFCLSLSAKRKLKLHSAFIGMMSTDGKPEFQWAIKKIDDGTYSYYHWKEDEESFQTIMQSILPSSRPSCFSDDISTEKDKQNLNTIVKIDLN